MDVGDVVNWKLLLAVAAASVLALLVGIWLAGSLLSSDTPAARAEIVHFRDDVSKVSLDYPSSWTRVTDQASDPEVALRVTDGDAMSLQVRVSDVGLARVTRKTLPVVRSLTDDLIGADPRAKQLVAPVAVVRGGLPGWRYRYTYASDATNGAHDHYFLFKAGRMIQLVFQAQPADQLPRDAATFDRIAATFQGFAK
ncbi:MAG: hypothetical protein QOD37_49 [Gaiellales bacterium]|jgi:hypothetical protein|nr:hypothetical protein [Gaiellales bacterium]